MADSSRYKDIFDLGAVIMLNKNDVNYIGRLKPILKNLWQDPAELGRFLDKTDDYKYATDKLFKAGIISGGTKLEVHRDEMVGGSKKFHLCIPMFRNPENEDNETEHELLMKLCTHMLRSCADGC